MELIRSTNKFDCDDSFSMSVYVSRPTSPDRVPGILFIYEAFGMYQEMNRIADEFALEGYAVMVPDLFERGSWFSCIRKLMSELKAGAGQGVQDLIAARNWLAEQAYTDSERIAVMGLCMGGGFALLLAPTGLFQVSAPFYGQVPSTLAGSCPIVASYGGLDRMLLKDAERLENELVRLDIPHDMKVYPQAGHSFMNRPRNKFIGFITGAMKAVYEPIAANDAKRRVLDFLEEHL